MHRRFLLLLAASGPALSLAQNDTSKNSLVDPYKNIEAIPVELVSDRKSPWSSTIQPYGWLPALAGDVGVHDFHTVYVDYDTKTLLQDLKWGLFVRAPIADLPRRVAVYPVSKGKSRRWRVRLEKRFTGGPTITKHFGDLSSAKSGSSATPPRRKRVTARLLTLENT